MSQMSRPPRRWEKIKRVILGAPPERDPDLVPTPSRRRPGPRLVPPPGVRGRIKAALTSTCWSDRVRGAPVEALPARAVTRGRQGRHGRGAGDHTPVVVARCPHRSGVTPPEVRAHAPRRARGPPRGG